MKIEEVGSKYSKGNVMTKQIQEAYIVAATRTPVGKAPRGMFRNTRPDDLLALNQCNTMRKFDIHKAK